MHSLREVQSRFVAAILGGPDADAGQLVPGGNLAPAQRVGIYRNNARVNFSNALAAAFPALGELLGPESFRQMAWAYQREHPSPSGNLFHVGQRLAGFLAGRLDGTPDEYLADVARLEWAAQEVIAAADSAEVPDMAALASVPPERYGALRFRFHPAARLLASRFPIFRIWQAHRAEPRAGERVDPAAGPEQVLLRRLGAGVELHRLPAGEYACLAALHAGQPLEPALEAALPFDADLDLGALLQRGARLGVLTGFELPADPGAAPPAPSPHP